MATIVTARIAAVAACLVLAGCSAGPEATARGFMEDKAAGRTAEALARVDPQMKQVAGPLVAAMLAAESAKATKLGGLENVEVVDTRNTDADHSVVRIKGHYRDGTATREQAKLRRVGGEWYVTM